MAVAEQARLQSDEGGSDGCVAKFAIHSDKSFRQRRIYESDFTRSLYGRRSFNTYTHPTTRNRCRDLQMSPGVQQHILPGSKHRLLSMVQKYDGYVDDRHRSSRRGKSLPVQRKIQYLQHRDGILLELSRKYRGTKMRHLRGQFLRACRLRLQTVSLPASGQKIFKYLHDSRQRRTDLRLQTWLHREEVRALLGRLLRIPSSARWKMHAVRMQPGWKFER